ncbi:unnamed protein product, partial [Choristocarpus tenellus]
MWRTSLVLQLDRSSLGREQAFQVTLDFERQTLAASISIDEEDSIHSGYDLDAVQPCSPYLVCTKRHPDAVQAVEDAVERARTQLTYSKGNTSCLLAGLRPADLTFLGTLKDLLFVDPLPHTAKLATSLHAELKEISSKATPLSSENEGQGEKENAEMNQDRKKNEGHVDVAPTTKEGARFRANGRTATETATTAFQYINFNHGEVLPDGLEVSLTPGAWSTEAAAKWSTHLKSFDSVRCLWDQHIRERFLWTHSKHSRTMDSKHSLSDVTQLWKYVAWSSSQEGTCDLGRLHVDVQNEDSTTSTGRNWGRRNGRHHETRGIEEGSRAVLRGVGTLGETSADHSHCLMTLVAYLSTRAEVAYIDDLPPVRSANTEASWIIQSGSESTFPVWDEDIQGQTEIVAVADSGLDRNSCYFREDDGDNIACSTYTSPVCDITKRKVVQYVGYVDCEDYQDGHGTHVSGTVAGAMSGTSSGEHLGDGVGFHSKIAIFDFGNSKGELTTPSNIKTQMLDPPYAIGARISTNSWGAIRTYYTSLDRQLDDFAYNNDDMLILVAAGNCGDSSSGCSHGGQAINGAGSVLSPALAKNVVGVGASESAPSSAGLSDNVNEIAYFSSQGPTAGDSRIKPDIVAPGYHLFSAQANPNNGATCSIGAMAGTSMATPVAAGAAALIRQFFLQGWYPNGFPNPSDIYNPSNALVKAMLVASATGMESYNGRETTVPLGSPPDGYQGFGRILLDTVLNLHGSVDLYVEDRVEITHSQVHTYHVITDGVSSSDYNGDIKA